MDLLRLSQNLRAVRLAQGMTLDQLAAKSGFSKGFISQVENFRITPSLKALNKLAAALGVEMSQIFLPEKPESEYTFGSLASGEEVVRDNGGRFGMNYAALAYRQIGRKMDPFLVEYRRTAEERDFMRHETEEFFLLMEGQMDFYVLDEKTVSHMQTGDTVYLRANLPHKARLARGCDYAKALIVYAEPGKNRSKEA